MTVVTFEYTDSYRKSSRGGLAFMPHRRHAANETEVLPNPFTISLKDGRASVNLEPNDETWVWMVTENIGDQLDTYFISVPDRDDSIPFNTITKINPSTLPAPYDAVEPVWWAEVREYKRTVGETLTKAEEAVDIAETAIEDGERYRDEARVSASDSKAYSHQSRDYAYESKEHRDEAERQADRATEGPESAQAQAEQARDESVEARNDSQAARDTSLEYLDQTREARDAAQTYRDEAGSARVAAEVAQTNTESARDESVQARNQAQQYRDDILSEPENILDQIQQQHSDIDQWQNTVDQQHTEVNKWHQEVQDYSENITQWAPVNYMNGHKNQTSTTPLQERKTPNGIQVIGAVNTTSADNEVVAKLSERTLQQTYQPCHAETIDDGAPSTTHLNILTNGTIALPQYETHTKVFINVTIPLE